MNGHMKSRFIFVEGVHAAYPSRLAGAANRVY